MKITDYKIVNHAVASELARIVKSWIERGYTPFGRPFVVDGHFYQAMVVYGA